jgi:hypothetical protein
MRLIETWKIVRDLVLSMSITLDVGTNQWVDNGDGTFTLSICKTYWLDTLTEVTINSVVYPIDSVVNDVSITVTSATVPDNTIITIPNPFFYSGTIIQSNEEISNSNKDVSARTPMAYLYRDIEDTFLPADSIVERETPIRLFFLHEEDFANFTSEVNSDEVLEPMRQMAYYFIDTLKRSSQIGKIDSNYNIRDYSKFGVDNISGYTQNIFNDQYSGVELSITLPILVDYRCGC